MLAIINYFRRLTSEAYDPLSILIEWVLIGLVVYAVLRFLAGTRGARLMKGIGLLLIVAFIVVRGLANRLHLERIQMLYQYFLAAAFLTALVAFQPELRRGLIRLGETPWFERWLRRPSGAIEPIVAAVKRLADQRIGALIAIEREVGLGGVIETGVRLDAKLTSELLETIFWPGSALHDMGLIVRRPHRGRELPVPAGRLRGGGPRPGQPPPGGRRPEHRVGRHRDCRQRRDGRDIPGRPGAFAARSEPRATARAAARPARRGGTGPASEIRPAGQGSCAPATRRGKRPWPCKQS